MTTESTQTIDAIIPNTTSRMILRGAMRRSFPEDRAAIEQYLLAFATTSVRYSRIEPDTKALQHYFLHECGLPEFNAAWYKSRIEEYLMAAKANQRAERLRE